MKGRQRLLINVTVTVSGVNMLKLKYLEM